MLPQALRLPLCRRAAYPARAAQAAAPLRQLPQQVRGAVRGLGPALRRQGPADLPPLHLHGRKLHSLLLPSSDPSHWQL